MARDEPTGVLYDYLYKDSERIASYYAQVFSGRLTSLEETDASRDASDNMAKGGVGVLGGEVRTVSETTVTSRRLSDPHDLLTTDILSHFSANGHLSEAVGDALHGGLVIAQGTLVFVDRLMVELASVAVEQIVNQEKRKPTNKQDQSIIVGMKLAMNALQKMSIPSGFLLKTADGDEIVGTIKDEGMQEPISTYYFKHGVAGLAGVYMVGIKEVPSHTFTLPDGQFIGAAQAAAQFLNGILFPAEAIRVTPIALFRKLW